MDLCAAFDRVDHSMLLDVLESQFGITDIVLQWCRSYLENRSFKVSVAKHYSDGKTFIYSVLQGSCNGPVYYCLYASRSTLQYHVDKDVSLNAFTDDHTINHSFDPNDSDSEGHSIEKLERNLCNIKKWMHQNRLKMNPTKMELIYFGSSRMLAKCSINTINVVKDAIPGSDYIKYLGAWLDNILNYKIHVQKKYSIAMWNIYKIRQIREYIDVDTLTFYAVHWYYHI